MCSSDLYAGGIVSSALDGINCAMAVYQMLNPQENTEEDVVEDIDGTGMDGDEIGE